MSKKLTFVVRQPAPRQIMEQASRAISAGKLSASDAQSVERHVAAGKTLPPQLMQKVREGSK